MTLELDLTPPSPELSEEQQRWLYENFTRLQSWATMRDGLPLMRWRGPWIDSNAVPAIAGEFAKDDVTRDGRWTMVANKDTIDRPAPLPDGNPLDVSSIPGTPPAFTINTFPDTIYYGNQITWDTGGFNHNFRWYAPDDSGNFQYEVWLFNLTANLMRQIVAPTIPTFTGWRTIQATELWRPGDAVNLTVVGRAVNQPSLFEAEWQTVNANQNNPGAGEAVFRNNATELRIHNTDYNGVNRAADLGAIEEDASLTFADTTWTVTGITTASDQHRFTVTPNQGRPPAAVYMLTWQWGSVDPVPYPVVPNWYSGSPYPEGTVKGFFGSVYPPQVLDDSFYGVDINLERAVVSDDWDLLAHSSVT